MGSVRVNVGGTIFETTESTLRQSAFFEALLSSRWATKSGAETIPFVDRSPEGFGHVLELLRDPRYPFPWLRWEQELDFYGIDSRKAISTEPVTEVCASSEYDSRDQNQTRLQFELACFLGIGEETESVRSLGGFPIPVPFFGLNSSPTLRASPDYKRVIAIEPENCEPGESVFKLKDVLCKGDHLEIMGIWLRIATPELDSDPNFDFPAGLEGVLKNVTVEFSDWKQTFTVEQLSRRHRLRAPGDLRYLDFWTRGKDDPRRGSSLLRRIEGWNPEVFRVWIPFGTFRDVDTDIVRQTLPAQYMLRKKDIILRAEWVSAPNSKNVNTPDACLLLLTRDFVRSEFSEHCRKVLETPMIRLLHSATSKIYFPATEEPRIHVRGFRTLLFDLDQSRMNSGPITGATFELRVWKGDSALNSPFKTIRIAQISFIIGAATTIDSENNLKTHRWSMGELDLLHDMARRGLHPIQPIYDADFSSNSWLFDRYAKDGWIQLLVPDFCAPRDSETCQLHVDWRQIRTIMVQDGSLIPMYETLWRQNNK